MGTTIKINVTNELGLVSGMIRVIPERPIITHENIDIATRSFMLDGIDNLINIPSSMSIPYIVMVLQNGMVLWQDKILVPDSEQILNVSDLVISQSVPVEDYSVLIAQIIEAIIADTRVGNGGEGGSTVNLTANLPLSYNSTTGQLSIDLSAINNAIANKADAIHSQGITTIVGLADELENIETAVSNNAASIVLLDNALDTKQNTLGFTPADSANVYTRTETDTLLGQKANSNSVYTRTETDTLLNAKQNTLGFTPANSANVYSKTETDTLLSGKSNTGHTHAIADITNLQTTLNTLLVMQSGQTKLTVWRGTETQYNAVTPKDANTIYFRSAG